MCKVTIHMFGMTHQLLPATVPQKKMVLEKKLTKQEAAKLHLQQLMCIQYVHDSYMSFSCDSNTKINTFVVQKDDAEEDVQHNTCMSS